MALSAHIDVLESRHRDLDSKIRQIAQKPGFEELKIAELKKKKLVLKDKINSLKNNTNN